MRSGNRPIPRSLLFLALVLVACTPQLEPLPADHPAAQIAVRVDNADDFGREAVQMSLPWICGSGDRPEWEMCLLHADGVAGLVTFGSVEGMVALITTTGLGHSYVVDLDETKWVGINREPGAIEVTLQRGGQTVGSLGSDVFPAAP